MSSNDKVVDNREIPDIMETLERIVCDLCSSSTESSSSSDSSDIKTTKDYVVGRVSRARFVGIIETYYSIAERRKALGFISYKHDVIVIRGLKHKEEKRTIRVYIEDDKIAEAVKKRLGEYCEQHDDVSKIEVYNMEKFVEW